MNYKIEGTIRRNKGRFIIFAVLWLFMAIVLVAPLAYAQNRATVNGVFNFGECVTAAIGAYSKFGEVIRKFWKLYSRIFWITLEMHYSICCIYVYRICKNSSKK